MYPGTLLIKAPTPATDDYLTRNIICWLRSSGPPRLVLTCLWLKPLYSRSLHGISHQGSVMDAPALFGRDDTANYCVYAKDPQNEDQATAIYTLLKGVVRDPSRIFSATTDNGTQHCVISLLTHLLLSAPIYVLVIISYIYST